MEAPAGRARAPGLSFAALPPELRFPGAELLRTRRLRLRGLVLGDARELLWLHRDPRVSAHLLEPLVSTPVEAAALVIWANRVAQGRPGLGVWRVDDAGGFAGIYSLMPLPDGAVELGGSLLARAWGRLYPLEGGRALCRHAFETLRLPRLLGLCDPANRPVPAVLRRLGFSEAAPREHFGRRALCFEISSADWRALNSGAESACAE